MNVKIDWMCNGECHAKGTITGVPLPFDSKLLNINLNEAHREARPLKCAMMNQNTLIEWTVSEETRMNVPEISGYDKDRDNPFTG